MNWEKNQKKLGRSDTAAAEHRKTFTTPKLTNTLLWLLFLASVGLIFLYPPAGANWSWEGIFRVNDFTLLIWSAVTFFSAIIGSYAGQYLTGFRYRNHFALLSLGFTVAVLLFVAADHIVLFLLSWLAMGIFMAGLIGVDRRWEEAKQAALFAQKYFLAGTLFLTVAIILLALNTGKYSLSGIIPGIAALPGWVTISAALCIITASIIQSAIYPFHRWLLSAMTAPTPASALMHAGFVNGAGILLAIFATLLFISDTLSLLFIIGGLTAIIAQFTKLLQVNVKQKLGCSTIAQMGFMIMQCGLGFFNAAVAHLILHGFYKAYLFLSAGEGIQQSVPQKPLEIKIKPLQAIMVLIFGLLGAGFFTILTGKGANMDSGIFLTLIVAITVGQATYNIVKQHSLSFWQKSLLLPTLFISGIGMYALVFNGVSFMMSDMPFAADPLALSPIQVIFGLIFLLGFFVMKLGGYRKIPWLYVTLMNISQPYKNSVLYFKSKSV